MPRDPATISAAFTSSIRLGATPRVTGTPRRGACRRGMRRLGPAIATAPTWSSPPPRPRRTVAGAQLCGRATECVDVLDQQRDAGVPRGAEQPGGGAGPRVALVPGADHCPRRGREGGFPMVVLPPARLTRSWREGGRALPLDADLARRGRGDNESGRVARAVPAVGARRHGTRGPAQGRRPGDGSICRSGRPERGRRSLGAPGSAAREQRDAGRSRSVRAAPPPPQRPPARPQQVEWGEQDSNLRRHSQCVYSASPLTTRTSPRWIQAILEADRQGARRITATLGSPWDPKSQRSI